MTDQERAAMQQALEALEQDNPAGRTATIAALRAALAQKPEPVCKCDLRTRLVGDGCEVCNPELAAEFAQQAEPVQEPLVWKPTWRLHALTQREYDSLEESVRWHYKRIAPPKAEPAQQPGPAQEPVAVPWQGGLTNDELLREWSFRLPGVTPTDRELSAFAIGIEAGYKVVWMQRPPLTDDTVAVGIGGIQFHGLDTVKISGGGGGGAEGAA